MATHTPRFNLSQPENTDEMQSFMSDYANNMNIIDQNLGGGGGSGGHTIIDENGQSMTQRTGLEFTGNVSVTDDSVNDKTIVDVLGGGGNVYGAFVDPSRVITSGSWTSSLSYTATEDCFVFIDGDLQNSHLVVNIDGVKIYDLGSSTYVEQMQLYPVRKGQTLTATKSTNYALNYIVYGLTQGTNGIYAPVIYSDTERVIGVWRDNKPLYQRTFVLSSPINVNGSGTLLPNDIQTALADVEIMVDSECARDSTYSAFISPYVYKSGGQWYILSADNWGNVKFITLRYTKTTDVAGSGNWNTDGVPTHHYSTSEQVIGTWIDGKPLYERVFTGLSIALNGNDWVYFNDPTDIENVIDFKAFADNSGRLLNCAITEYQRSNTNGIMFSGITGFNRTVNVIVARFTKTTD